jgi:hypothetical protein
VGQGKRCCDNLDRFPIHFRNEQERNDFRQLLPKKDIALAVQNQWFKRNRQESPNRPFTPTGWLAKRFLQTLVDIWQPVLSGFIGLRRHVINLTKFLQKIKIPLDKSMSGC